MYYLENFPADIWSFILAGDHLEIDAILTQSRDFVTERLHEAPDQVRQTFRVELDFSQEELEKVKQEEVVRLFEHV